MRELLVGKRVCEVYRGVWLMYKSRLVPARLSSRSEILSSDPSQTGTAEMGDLTRVQGVTARRNTEHSIRALYLSHTYMSHHSSVERLRTSFSRLHGSTTDSTSPVIRSYRLKTSKSLTQCSRKSISTVHANHTSSQGVQLREVKAETDLHPSRPPLSPPHFALRGNRKYKPFNHKRYTRSL